MIHEYLTRHEAADALRMSVSQLDALARTGKIRCAKLPSGPTAKKGEGGTQARARVLYRRTDLDAFFDAHTNDDVAV